MELDRDLPAGDDAIKFVQANLEKLNRSEIDPWMVGLNSQLPDAPNQSTHLITFIASIPVLASIITTGHAFGAPPAYFNDKHFILIGVLTLWTGSAVSTPYLARFGAWLSDQHSKKAEQLVLGEDVGATGWSPGKTGLILISAKDVIIGMLTPSFLLALSIGFLSNCDGWRRRYNIDSERDTLRLEPMQIFEKNIKVLFPIMIGICLATHLGYFSSLRWWLGRSGIGLLKNDKSGKKGVTPADRRDDRSIEMTLTR
jgi:hypothetical protein